MAECQNYEIKGWNNDILNQNYDLKCQNWLIGMT